ncbi:FumA C-terminus/TtdB family hydratase beta subunit [Fodinicurvata sp. EGI_FJ10296]|uniref:FumA C-terminus/TtdB family hydratase beta subunit n=1 Tax=Fodinicurvata sp. EGI_FJ10296 TaxID=3231908 RepID=UPI003454B831
MTTDTAHTTSGTHRETEPGPVDYSPIFQPGPDDTVYRRLSLEEGETVELRQLGDRRFLEVSPAVLTRLAREAFTDISHLYRPAHLKSLAAILEDPEASDNDRTVAREMFRNAVIAAAGKLPMCQDTGTAIVTGTKGECVLTGGTDAAALSAGIAEVFRTRNLRFSQLAPLSMDEERNTGTNLPAQIDIAAGAGDRYKLLFIAKGGGSANKTFLFQQNKGVLREDRLLAFLEEKIRALGTAACPPYHLSIVIGGLSAEQTLKTVKLASCKELDALPETGSPEGRAFRDKGLEEKILHITRDFGIGAQFGGKYFCHDVRVVRLPRHNGSLPIGLGVSCSADRQAKAYIDEDGVFLEALERSPERLLPDIAAQESTAVPVDLNQPMDVIRATLTRHPVGTRLSLTGPMIVARDLVHAYLEERLSKGEPLPDYMKNHPIYYAGPAKTPEGMASGSFGPTTAARMDSYVPAFQAVGASLVMLAKGNRDPAVTASCREHGGFYLGTIGGVAARLAQDCITSVEALDFEEFGMEAVWKIEVENFDAFIVVDDKGNSFFDR